MANRNRNVAKERDGEDRFPKGKGKSRPKSRGKRGKEFIKDDEDMQGVRVNDPKWWFDNKELFEQCCQLSMQNIVGATSIISNTYPMSFALVMLNPSPGVTPYNSSDVNVLEETGLNMQSLKLYQQLSMKSGRNATYAPQDISTMILAMGELLSMEEYIRRFFGLACVYNERNWTVPKSIIDRLGCDSDDLFERLAAYRMRFNTDITRLNTLPIIADVPYFKKCVELYSGVYTDGVSPMSGLWAYTPATTWTLDEDTSTSGSMLTTQPVHATSTTDMTPKARTMSAILTQFENMIGRLFNSSTLHVVYSDLLNLASQNHVGLMKVDYCFETYQVIPAFSDEANLHLRHTTFVGAPLAYSGSDPLTNLNDVKHDPDNNRILYNPTFASSNVNRTIPRFIVDFHDSGNPSLEAKLEATRFVSAPSSIVVEATQPYSYNYVLPDHYAVRFQMFTGGSTTPGAGFNRNWIAIGSNAGVMLQMINGLEQLDSHPFIYFYATETDDSITQVFGDVDFYTTVDRGYIERLNRITQLSLYNFLK